MKYKYYKKYSQTWIYDRILGYIRLIGLEIVLSCGLVNKWKRQNK